MLIWIGSITGALFLTILVFIVWTIQRKNNDDNDGDNDDDNGDNGGFNIFHSSLIVITVFIVIGLVGIHEFQLFERLGWISKITENNSRQITNLTTDVNTVIENQDTLSSQINTVEKKVQETRKEATQAKNFAQKSYEKGREIRKNQTENYYLLSGKLNRNRQAINKIPDNVQKQIDTVVKDFQSQVKVGKMDKKLINLLEEETDLDKEVLDSLKQSDADNKKIIELLEQQSSSPEKQKKPTQTLTNQIDALLDDQKAIKANQENILEGQKVTGQQIQNSTETILEELRSRLEESRQITEPPTP